ncbi:MAG TPA: hypothetical protein VK139_05110 [Microbacteriaceae bacterium]|nr:hypothetical protein [Microbacteriaceae bacterium]
MTGSRASARVLTLVSIAAAVAVVAITAVGVALTERPAPIAARPQPSATETATPVPTPEPSIIPASCDGIYTRDWAKELAPFVLNPDWTKTDGGIGTNARTLEVLLAPNVRLTCHWGKETGGGDSGIITSVAQLDDAGVAEVKARINELNWTCFDVSGGVRCITEESDPNGTWGESHFLRDGVWVATRWVNLAPDGYTADIISSIWKG